jgi:PIN domain nuclease of toxin-antitoxin system
LRLLLDSHAYLWWLKDDRKLSAAAKAAIADPQNAVWVSAATIWELEIKRAMGRLHVGGSDLAAEISANEFGELPVRASQAVAAAHLPARHSDPFDRMLIAQAQAEGLVCVTADPAVAAYGAATLW